MDNKKVSKKEETRGRKALPPGKKRIQRNISISPDVWEKAQSLFPSVSAEIENCLIAKIKIEERKSPGQ